MSTRLAVLCGAAAVAVACNGATATSPTDPTQDINSLSSAVNPGGGVAREFTLITAGTVAVTLTTTTPPGILLGLGIGIPRANGSCAVSDAVVTAAGSTPQIALPAEAARYCAKVFDPGTVTQPTAFTVVITRPQG